MVGVGHGGVLQFEDTVGAIPSLSRLRGHSSPGERKLGGQTVTEAEAMLVRRVEETAPNTEIPGVALRTLIGEEQGAPRFAMRVFEVAPGGSTPFHDHWWEHEVFILGGTGVVRTVDGETPLKSEDAVLVPGGEMHCFTNIGSEPFRFICVIPTATAQPPASNLEAPVCDPVALPTR
jgi:quercetin dioxygenase-like cupin family protein